MPTEPKRYLHRVGRTARAGSHGVSVTFCNDEERKDIKKVVHKMGQNVMPYNLPQKVVQQIHEFITSQIDPILQKLTLELDQDDEI